MSIFETSLAFLLGWTPKAHPYIYLIATIYALSATSFVE